MASWIAPIPRYVIVPVPKSRVVLVCLGCVYVVVYLVIVPWDWCLGVGVLACGCPVLVGCDGWLGVCVVCVGVWVVLGVGMLGCVMSNAWVWVCVC